MLPSVRLKFPEGIRALPGDEDLVIVSSTQPTVFPGEAARDRTASAVRMLVLGMHCVLF